MTLISNHLAAMFDLTGGSWTFIVMVTGIGAWIIRNHVTNFAVLLFFIPCAVLLAVIANYVFVITHVYEPSKLGEWIVWMIVSAALGNMAAVGLVAGLANLMDRDGRPATP